MDELKLHDVVALTRAIPEHNLRRGEIGVVIDIGPNGQCLLEFADRNGVPYAIAYCQYRRINESVFTRRYGGVTRYSSSSLFRQRFGVKLVAEDV